MHRQHQAMSRGDLLALIDRATPIVGVEQQASDPVAGCMLRGDAVELLDQLSLKCTGLDLVRLLAWRTERDARERRAKQRQREAERTNRRTAA